MFCALHAGENVSVGSIVSRVKTFPDMAAPLQIVFNAHSTSGSSARGFDWKHLRC